MGEWPSLLAIVLSWIAWFTPAIARAQSTKSHTRFVRVAEAKVYCGPSESLYVTSILKQGDSVEIFHVTEDGWAGIRPPESSFDWLEAEHAYLLPGGRNAEVVGQPVPCWIGSSVDSPGKFRWQIELQPTQQVRVLGEAKQVIDSGAERLWYKIAPPPGEFRWIRLVDLDKQPVSRSSPDDQRSSPSNAAGANTSDAVEDADVVPAQFLADGSWIVDETLPSPTTPKMQNIESTIVDESYYDGESIVTEECDTCHDCGGAPCKCHCCFLSRLGLSCGCGRDPTQGRVVQRLNGILGLVGFGVARLPLDPTPVEPGVFRSNLEPVPSRLDHLPRPGGRTRLRQLRNPFGPLGTQGFLTSYDETASRSPLDAEKYASTSLGEVGTGLAQSSVPRSSVPDFTLFAASLGSTYRSDPLQDNHWHGLGGSDLAHSKTAASSHEVDSATLPFRTSEPSSMVVPAASWTPSNAPRAMPSTPSTSDPLELSSPSLQSALVELSMMVARPMEQWEFGNLKEFANRIIDRGTHAIERGEARLLLQRIEQFESLRNRSGIGPQTSTSPSGDGDASGWLVQVHKSLPNQPEFALADLAGNIVAYVDPAPGVNLRRYVREAVVVYGSRGYLPTLNAKHITAERVVRMHR